jgi:hypothetical protein
MSLVATFAALALAAGQREDAFTGCYVKPDQLPRSAPRFAAYAVPKERAFRPAPVRLETRDARLFRTQLRTQAKEPPDFAGHYRVAYWGCGTGCMSFAVVDQKTGRVSFPPDFNIVEQVAAAPLDHVTNQVGSRLLIVTGMLDEDEKRLGVYFYEMTPKGLKRVKRLTYDQVCAGVPRRDPP